MDKQKKAPTIYDVAKAASVSPATVSRVLNGNTKVSPAIAQKVNEKMSELEFRPNALARSLISTQSRTIGILVPDIRNPHFSTLYYELEQQALKHGFSTILSNTESSFEQERHALNYFYEKRVDGIVFAGGRMDQLNIPQQYVDEVLEISRTIPIVSTSRNNQIKIPQYYPSEKEAIFELVEHLHSQGCVSMALLGGDAKISISSWRRQLFLNACSKFHITCQERWILDGSMTMEGGYYMMRRLYENTKTPDTVCCMNDLVAVGCLFYAQENRIRIPNDVMLTGFDGYDLTNWVYPQITTIKTNYPQFAQMVMEGLLSRIKDGFQKTVGSTELTVIVKSSTKRNIG